MRVAGLTITLLVVVLVFQPTSNQSVNAQFLSLIDYDTDDDSLIEVSYLEQLDAIRYDLSGDGLADDDSDDTYESAFSDAAPGMGCPGEVCAGYELARMLNFADPDSYASGSADRGWSEGEDGVGWAPIGRSDLLFDTAFEGNGHSISNLFIKDAGHAYVGLFGSTGPSSDIRRVGLVDVKVGGGLWIGALVGWNDGEISASYSTGSVFGERNVGGLVGLNGGTIRASSSAVIVSGESNVGGLVGSSGRVISSFATGRVTGDRNAGGLVGSNGREISVSYATGDVGGGDSVGGLVGINDGSIKASYATGRVSGTRSVGGLVGSNRGLATGLDTISSSYATGTVSSSQWPAGLVGANDSLPGAITASYWDVQTTGQALGVAVGSDAGVEGKTTGEMQVPVGYSDIYSDWNIDVDNADGDSGESTGVDDPWDFGTTMQYPVLKVDFDGDGKASWEEFGRQQRVPVLRTSVMTQTSGTNDYDADDDGLIEISYLEQLKAVHYDLDGDGQADDAANMGTYGSAFPGAAVRMGCPDPGCMGYELVRDLDFDASNSYVSAAVDRGWSRAEGGEGWQPIGVETASYDAVFDGNGYVIANLFVSKGAGRVGLFKSVGYRSEVREVGLVAVEVIGGSKVGGLAAINGGTISRSYVTGLVAGRSSVGGLVGLNQGAVNSSYVEGTVLGDDGAVGGLIGENYQGMISRSYASGDVLSNGDYAGGLAGQNHAGLIVSSFFTGEVVGDENVGGLTGMSFGGSKISSSYSTGIVSGTKYVGGLAGRNWNAVSYSYSAADVSGDEDIGGLFGSSDGPARIRASYWSSESLERLTEAGVEPSVGGEGKTSAELQTPAGYTGIYGNWNMDVDETSGADNPWDFGTDTQYPALKADFNGDGVATWQEFGDQRGSIPARTDYDRDNNGLMEVSNLDQLDAMRYDPDGDGEIDPSGQVMGYLLAFPKADWKMGCPTQGCIGYELTRDLDFNDPSSYASGPDRQGRTRGDDSQGWVPIGSGQHIGEETFNATFDGNHHFVANLVVDPSYRGIAGLFASIGHLGAIHRVGLVNALVSGRNDVGGLVGSNYGAITASYVTGSVSGDMSENALSWGVPVGVGGLAGVNQGTISSSYFTGDVSGDWCVGGLVGGNMGAVSASYAASDTRGNQYVGGFAGTNQGMISAGYATGSVSGEHGVGGLVGENEGRTTASYALATVSGSEAVGGLVGLNRRPDNSIISSYWDVEFSGQPRGVGIGYSSGAKSFTTAALQRPTDYSGPYGGWNIDIDDTDGDQDETTGRDDPWDFGSADQYPALRVDFDGDGTASWQEFGTQSRERLAIAASMPIPRRSGDSGETRLRQRR